MLTEQIDPNRMYSTAQTAKLTQLSTNHISRLVDAGEFPGSYRKSPVPSSPRVVPGSAIISFLEKRQQQ